MENIPNIHVMILRALERVELALQDIKTAEPPVLDKNGLDTRQYLDVNHTAEFLYCSKPYVYELKHRIPYILRGGRLYFKKSDLEDYLEAGKKSPDPGKIRKKKTCATVK